MMFPFDSKSSFSDPRAGLPTQRPASRSDVRKRDGEPSSQPADATFGRESAGADPHLDNGFAEVIRKAQEKAWDEGFEARYFADLVNPYRSAS